MLPTDRQISHAYRIDQYVQEIEAAGGSDAEILQGMHAFMDTLKYLLDTTQGDQLDLLCTQFDGFWHFAKLLEDLAGGIASGDIEIP